MFPYLLLCPMCGPHLVLFLQTWLVHGAWSSWVDQDPTISHQPHRSDSKSHWAPYGIWPVRRICEIMLFCNIVWSCSFELGPWCLGPVQLIRLGPTISHQLHRSDSKSHWAPIWNMTCQWEYVKSCYIICNIIQILTATVLKYHVSVNCQESYMVPKRAALRQSITILAPRPHNIPTSPGQYLLY